MVRSICFYRLLTGKRESQRHSRSRNSLAPNDATVRTIAIFIESAVGFFIYKYMIWTALVLARSFPDWSTTTTTPTKRKTGRCESSAGQNPPEFHSPTHCPTRSFVRPSPSNVCFKVRTHRRSMSVVNQTNGWTLSRTRERRCGALQTNSPFEVDIKFKPSSFFFCSFLLFKCRRKMDL